MEAFDALPAPVRRAIASAAFPFSPLVALRFLRRGLSAERVAGLIAAADLRLSRKVAA